MAKTKTNTYPWWIKNEVYSIPDLWNDLAMPPATVAILDSGITKHVDFDFNAINGYNYIQQNTAYKSDAFGHGTHVCGLIASRGSKSFGVYPKANLFIAKVCDDSGTPSLIAVKNALVDIYNGNAVGAPDIDVINMSFQLAGVNDAERGIISDIRDLLGRLYDEKGILLVAACGDEDWERDYFPAYMEECISVGSIGADFKRWPFSTKTITLDIMSPGEGIISSMGTNITIGMDGTSQSAAMVSGLCAMGAALVKKRTGTRNAIFIKKALFQTAVNHAFSLNEYGHGIFHPNEFIKTLKTI